MEITRIATLFAVMGLLLTLAGLGLPLFLAESETWVSVLLGAGGLLLAGYFVIHVRSIARFARNRSARLGLHSILSVILAGIIVALANFLAARHAPEWDFSETQNFTLSRQTYEVLRKLPREVRIKVFTHEGSPGYGPYQDLLTTYDHESNLVTVEFIDPEHQPGVAKEYQITQIDTAVFASGEQKIYVQRPNEAELTNALLRVSRDQKNQLAFLSGHGEASASDTESSGLSRAKDALTKQGYELTSLNLSELRASIQPSVLIIPSPTQPISLEGQQIIENFVKNGGRLLLMGDPDKETPLASVLKKWGIEMGNGILADAQDRLGRGSPTALLVRTFTTHDITEDFTSPILFPVSRSVNFDSEIGQEWDFVALAQTSPNSWEEMDRTNSQPTFEEGQDAKGPFTVAALLTSKAQGPDAQPLSAIVIIGNSAFATNGYFTYPGNTDFFLKTIAWLAKEDALVTLTPKDPAFHPFVPNPSQEQALVFFQVLFLPLLTLFLGLSVWKRRRSL
ncbi:MAG: GldG family protein [Nitrospirales bacterium]